jgi:hypothetical protein
LGSVLGLVYVEDVEDVCGGAIQNSERQRFCCKKVGTCSVKGHKTIKLKLEANTVYIQHTRAGQGRFEPSLGISLIREEITVSNLIGKEHALEVWTAYFDAP